MKVLLLLAILTGYVFAGPFITQHPLQPLSFGKPMPLRDPGLDLCPSCIEFAEQFINDLLNIILNAGVVGGCADLCQLLEKEVPSELVEVVCNLLCDYVGIKEFIKLVQDADLDPIYFCELLKVCPVDDNGDAKIISLKVIPNNVKKGDTFKIEMLFNTMNGTGTGEIDLLILTQDGIPVGEDELSEPLKPGSYNVTWSVRAKPDPRCDPTQEPCEMWLPGNYTVDVAICNGECGSKHPHSSVYDTASAPFNVTGR